MHKLICATATIVLCVPGLIPQAKSNRQTAALRELEGVAVTVRVTPKAQRKVLFESRIRADVEQQLRAAHVPLLGHPRDIVLEGAKRVNSFPPFLSVLVDITPQNSNLRAYKVEVVLSQDIADPQNPRAKTSIRTWSVTKVGIYSRRKLNGILTDIEMGVDQFITDYVAVNRK